MFNLLIWVLIFWNISIGISYQKSVNKSSESTSNIQTLPTKKELKLSNASFIDSNQLQLAYTQALEYYIVELNKISNLPKDTLLILDRKLGLQDDFPNIKLPNSINGIGIKIIPYNSIPDYENRLGNHLVLNIMGWVDSTAANFIIITFSPKGEPLFDLKIDYIYDKTFKTYKLDENSMILNYHK